jgi:hypothetical protein
VFVQAASTIGSGEGLFGTTSNHPLGFYVNAVKYASLTTTGLAVTGQVTASVTTTASDRAISGVNTNTSGTNYGGVFISSGTSATTHTGGYFNAAGATTNYGVRIAGPASGASNYAIYADATAQSYFAGNVGIGTASPAGKLQVTGSSASFILNTSGTEFYNTNAGTVKIYASNAAGALALSAGGRDAGDLFINSSGNVGIGTTSPASVLDVTSAASDAVASLTATGVQRWQLKTERSTGSFLVHDQSTPATRIAVTQAGNVGIGTTSPATKLQVNATGIAYNTAGLFITTAGGTDGIAIGDSGSGAYKSIQSYGGALVLNSLGNNVLVGTTTSYTGLLQSHAASADAVGVKVTGSGGSGIAISIANTNQPFLYLQYGGTAVGSVTYNGSLVLYNQTSDYRLKEITGPLIDSGSFIDALKPKVGTWKTNGSKFVGFVAHEFAEVSPSSVSGEKDAVDSDGKPVYQAMQASSAEVIANLVAELQSLRQRVAALESN